MNKVMVGKQAFNLDKVKKFAQENPNYQATHYLCLMPEKPVEGVFANSYIEVTGRKTHPAYWGVFGSKMEGYKQATEKYPIKNTKDGNYPKGILVK